MAASHVWRYSERDLVLVGLSAAHAMVLLGGPPAPVVAVGLWWGANTVSHNFIHLPFFRSSQANSLYSLFLTLVLGIPQSLWRARHLAHHAEEAGVRAQERLAVRWTARMAIECAMLVALWVVIGTVSPRYLWTAYLPGCALGLALCSLQGHFEHAGGTTSYYGRLYNLLFFNDGYHVEHHRRPTLHWTKLCVDASREAAPSRWPPILRWLESLAIWRGALNGLEQMVLYVPWLQRVVLRVHGRALRKALAAVGDLSRIVVVGGGLFPRSALLLRAVFPHATITVVDASAAHLSRARALLPPGVRIEHAVFDGRTTLDADLVVIPLAFVGDREAIYTHPPAPIVFVHDWIWRPRGRTHPISIFLLKRLNVIVRHAI